MRRGPTGAQQELPAQLDRRRVPAELCQVIKTLKRLSGRGAGAMCGPNISAKRPASLEVRLGFDSRRPAGSARSNTQRYVGAREAPAAATVALKHEWVRVNPALFCGIRPPA
jgi:hypothetical protein